MPMHLIRKFGFYLAISFVSSTLLVTESIAKQDGKLAVTSAVHKGKKGKRPSPAWTLMAQYAGTKLVINYARPSKRGRKIFGSLVPLDKVWRTGANEATTLEVNKPIKLGGKTVKPGKYGLFTIPGAKMWTIILNKGAKQWGAYSYSKKQDVLRVQAKVTGGKLAEQFTIAIKAGKGNQHSLVLRWDTTRVQLPISF